MGYFVIAMVNSTEKPVFNLELEAAKEYTMRSAELILGFLYNEFGYAMPHYEEDARSILTFWEQCIYGVDIGILGQLIYRVDLFSPQWRDVGIFDIIFSQMSHYSEYELTDEGTVDLSEILDGLLMCQGNSEELDRAYEAKYSSGHVHYCNCLICIRPKCIYEQQNFAIYYQMDLEKRIRDMSTNWVKQRGFSMETVENGVRFYVLPVPAIRALNRNKYLLKSTHFDGRLLVNKKGEALDPVEMSSFTSAKSNKFFFNFSDSQMEDYSKRIKNYLQQTKEVHCQMNLVPKGLKEDFEYTTSKVRESVTSVQDSVSRISDNISQFLHPSATEKLVVKAIRTMGEEMSCVLDTQLVSLRKDITTVLTSIYNFWRYYQKKIGFQDLLVNLVSSFSLTRMGTKIAQKIGEVIKGFYSGIMCQMDSDLTRLCSSGIIMGIFALFTSVLPSTNKLDKFFRRMDAIPKAMQGAERMCEMMRNAMDYSTKLVEKYILKRDVNLTKPKLIPEVQQWMDDISSMVEFKERKNIQRDPLHMSKVKDLHSRGVRLVKELNNGFYPRENIDSVKACMATSKILLDDCMISGAEAATMRMEPIIIMLVGDTGVGKSKIIYPLIMDMMTVKGEVNENWQKDVYSRTVETEYWDGYHGQNFIVYDDAFQMRDSVVKPNPEYMELIRLGNSMPYHVHMAALHDKNTYAEPEVVLLTSNTKTLKPESLTYTIAVTRRVDFAFSVSVDGNFRKTKVVGEGNAHFSVNTDKVRTPVDMDVYRFEKYDCVNGNILESDLSYLDVLEQLRECYGSKIKKHFSEAQFLEHYRKSINQITAEHKLGKSNDKKKEKKEREAAVLDFMAKNLKDEGITTQMNTVSDVDELLEKFFIQPSTSGIRNLEVLTAGHCDCTCLECSLRYLYHMKGDQDVTAYVKNFMTKETTKRMIQKNIIKLECSSSGACTFRVAIVDLDDYAKLTDKDLWNLVKSKTEKYFGIVKEKISQALGFSWKIFKYVLSHLSELFYVVASASVIYSTYRVGKIVYKQIVHSADFEKDCYRMNVISMETNKCMYDIGCENCDNCVEYEDTDNVFDLECRCCYDAYLKYEHEIRAFERKWLQGKDQKLEQIVQSANEKYKELRKQSKSTDKKKKEEITTRFQSKPDGKKQKDEIRTTFQSKPSDKKSKDEIQTRFQNDEQSIQTQNALFTVDHEAVSIIPSIYSNTKRLFIVDKKMQVIMDCGSIFFVSGVIALMPRHYIIYFEEHKEHSINLAGYQGLRSGIMNISEFLDLQRFEFEDRDLVLVEFPRNFVQLHRNMVHHFVSKKNYNHIHMSPGELCRYSFNDTKLERGSASLPRIRLCDEEISARTSNTDQGVLVKTRGAYEYWFPTIAGDCGSVLLVYNKNIKGSIIGIHTAGQINRALGFSAPICIEEIQEALETFKKISWYGHRVLVTEEDLDKETKLCQNGNGVPWNFELIETLDCKLGQPTKSKVKKTPCFNKIYESKVKPCHLKPFKSSSGEWIDPEPLARQKWGGVLQAPIKTISDYISEVLPFKLLESPNVEPNHVKFPLSYEQAVLGIEGDMFIRSINKKSSMGFPYTLDKSIIGGKKSIFGEFEFDLENHRAKQIQKDVEDLEQNFLLNYRPSVYWIDTKKDEKKEIVKVDQGKTRLFAAGPAHFTILTRRWVLPFLAHLMYQRIDNSFAVGINPLSLEWTRLYHHLLRSGRQYNSAGDFKNFDGTTPIDAHLSFWDTIKKWYAKHFDEILKQNKNFDLKGNKLELADIEQILDCICAETVNHCHLATIDGTTVVYQVRNGMPSGCPTTALENCYTNEWCHLYAWMVVMNGLLPVIADCSGIDGDLSCDRKLNNLTAFENLTSRIYYGDDVIVSCSPRIQSKYNLNTISLALSTISMTMTDESKNIFFLNNKPLEECTFLKRRFVNNKKLGIVLCPLELGSILEMTNWVHDGIGDLMAVLMDNFKTINRELALHDECVYNEWMIKLRGLVTNLFSGTGQYIIFEPRNKTLINFREGSMEFRF